MVDDDNLQLSELEAETPEPSGNEEDDSMDMGDMDAGMGAKSMTWSGILQDQSGAGLQNSGLVRNLSGPVRNSSGLGLASPEFFRTSPARSGIRFPVRRRSGILVPP